MSTWTDRIRSHAVWQQLESLGPAVDQALARDDVSASSLAGLNRIKTVVAFTGKRLAAGDSNLIPPGPLDALAASLQHATDEVQSFIGDGGDPYVVNANVHVDAALVQLGQIVTPLSARDIAGLREAADTYRGTLQSNLRQVQRTVATITGDLAGLRDGLTALTADISTERQRLSALAAEHQSQFSTAQEARSKDYLEAQTSRQDRFAALLLEYTQKLAEHSADFARQRDLLAQAQRDDLAALTASYREKAGSLLAEIEAQRVQVEKLVGVIGDLGVTSGYQKTANEARRTSRVWQFIAVSSLVAIIAVAYKAFLPLVQGVFSWESFAGRLFVSLTVGVLAAYAISQADKYQQVERRSRKLALELEALGPFLASLPTEQRDEFRIRVGDRTFGTSDDLVDRLSSDSPKSVLDVAFKSKDLRELVVSVIKATRTTP